MFTQSGEKDIGLINKAKQPEDFRLLKKYENIRNKLKKHIDITKIICYYIKALERYIPQ